MTPALQRRLAEALPEILEFSSQCGVTFWRKHPVQKVAQRVEDTEWLAVLHEAEKRLCRVTELPSYVSILRDVCWAQRNIAELATDEQRAVALLKVLNK
jgi:hypothetical protein